jgi:hypothetical protein
MFGRIRGNRNNSYYYFLSPIITVTNTINHFTHIKKESIPAKERAPT